MNRTIWIWRVIAIVILLACAILLMNLYARLTSMTPSEPARVETTAEEEESRRMAGDDGNAERRER